jgi:hypothetical protein
MVGCGPGFRLLPFETTTIRLRQRGFKEPAGNAVGSQLSGKDASEGELAAEESGAAIAVGATRKASQSHERHQAAAMPSGSRRAYAGGIST